jgi:hypothetical protein
MDSLLFLLAGEYFLGEGALLRVTHQSHNIGQFHDLSTNVAVFANTPIYWPI